jgi:hypothetical protein
VEANEGLSTNVTSARGEALPHLKLSFHKYEPQDPQPIFKMFKKLFGEVSIPILQLSKDDGTLE